MSATLQSQKRVLRKAMAKRLQSLSQSDIQQQSQLITHRVLASPYFQCNKNISCYLSMPSGEVETATLVSAILRAGKSLLVPKIDVTIDGGMDLLQIHDEEDLDALPGGSWGIREPAYERHGQRRPNALDESTEGLDVIFVPGVAFDRSLSRLGHGKGYYDRFVSTYTQSKSAKGHKKPLLVALALREQILEAGQVPTTLHDWKMDVIVSPDEALNAKQEP